MTLPRTTASPDRSRATFSRTIHPTIRTGTVLRDVRRLLAIAGCAVAASLGISRDAAAVQPNEANAIISPPGAIGASRRPQPGPRPEVVLPDCMQPVEIRGPAGMLVAIETASGWSPLRPAPLRMALAVGSAYRLKLGGLPGREGEELYPSVRVLARLAAPPGTAWRFPVEVVIDEDDVRTALDGSLVRRVVYASCESETPDLVPGAWFDVRPGDDPLEVARTLGDPVAEVVIGNRLPAELAP